MMDEIIKEHVSLIEEKASQIDRDITLMEVCGGHTNVIMKYGIRDLLPSNVRLVSGPGCPVCVTDQHDIDCIIEIAKMGVPVATYGDMLRVPGTNSSLEEVRARGGRVYDVYSAADVLKIKAKFPDVVFFGTGFETTAPMTAFLLDNGVSVYSVHKRIVPAMKALASGEMKIDGFIDPGHVSSIIGVEPYRAIGLPQVISGFSAEMVLRSIRVLLELIADGRNVVINGYPEAVHENGNMNALLKLANSFDVVDSRWRGLGVIPESGYEVRDEALNARLIFEDHFSGIGSFENTGCKCGDVLRGLISPKECPLYRNVCTPKNPKGACMVSSEGSCAISYQYGL